MEMGMLLTKQQRMLGFPETERVEPHGGSAAALFSSSDLLSPVRFGCAQELTRRATMPQRVALLRICTDTSAGNQHIPGEAVRLRARAGYTRFRARARARRNSLHHQTPTLHEFTPE